MLDSLPPTPGHLQAVTEFLDRVGDAIIYWGNPYLTVFPTKEWPLASFSGAFGTASTYFLAVMTLSYIVKSFYGSEEAARPTKKAANVWEKLKAEPILFFVVIYNPMQVILCSYMAYRVIAEMVDKNYSIVCNTFRQERTSMAEVFWIFYISKIFDYFDTLVIILRRKWRQLSFLHVYHHITIYLYCWMALRGGYDADVYFSTLFNCFVHMIMYSYYECTLLEIKVPTPIKKFITNLQMIQFISMNVHAILINVIMDCESPKNMAWVYLAYIFSLFLLFQDFSNKEYGKKKGAAVEAKKDE